MGNGMIKSDVGIVAVDKIGYNLARQFSKKGYKVTVCCADINTPDGYDASYDKQIKSIMSSFSKSNVETAFDIESMIVSLASPKKIFLLNRTGIYSEDIYMKIVSCLQPGDTIIDCCDSSFELTEKRGNELRNLGIAYLGVGIAGDEYSALEGMSFFVGGQKADYENVKSLLNAVSSNFHGISCCQYIGEGFAGRFAQMIFGGLEYSILEAISEAVMFLKYVLNFDGEEIHDTLCEWNESELGGYILGVFSDIVSCTDKDTGSYITDVVSDKAGYSRNVSRLSSCASELSVPISVINAAVYTRYLSKMVEKRELASATFDLKRFKTASTKEYDEDRLCECIRRSCYLTIITAVSQSIELLRKAEEKYGWQMNVAEVFFSFYAGTVIQCNLMGRVYDNLTLLDNNELPLFADGDFKTDSEAYLLNLRECAVISIEQGIPLPAIVNAISYIDCYCSGKLPTGILQLVRNYLGYDSYKRNDRKEAVTTDWNAPDGKVTSVADDNSDKKIYL
ncbi:MAG: hypothetical protein IJZ94_02170 [Clostridia bacterium]|nr:hypothetical protein [Clostridia bacterium]